MFSSLRARVALLALILLALVLFGAGCGDDEPVRHVDLTARERGGPRPDEHVITYAYLPQYSHTVSYRRHRRLIDYLTRETGLPLRQVFPDTFDEHVKMVERGEIDISFSNPFVYLRIAKSGARAFARIVEPTGKPDFRGQIICRKDNKAITSLEDCKGKRWIAVDPSSAGGYLFPLGLFADHGIKASDFSELAFAPGPGGKQEKVVLAVHAGQYDIGSIREGSLGVVEGKIDLGQIRVLATTPAYPGWVYAARKGLDPAVVSRIAGAMFKLDMSRADDAAILGAAGIRAIIPARDGDYDPVRRLAERLGLD